MNRFYPARHHPIFFLQDALETEGVVAEFHRDDISHGLWGLLINGRLMVWLIDIRWQHEKDKQDRAIRELLAEGALVCAAQKPDATHYGCHWLPLAVTPGYGLPDQSVKKIVDIGFVGYIRDEQRERVLLDLNRHHSISVLQGAFDQPALNTYHSARLGINIPTRYGDPAAYDSANMRFYEILATGTPLVTAHEDYLLDLGFEDGVHGFTYRHRQDCLNRVAAALAHPDLDVIGQQGAQLAQDRHTYAHRAKQVIQWLNI